MSGRMYGKASIMKFYKESARLDWYLKFEELTWVRAWAQVPNDRHFFACGDYMTPEADYSVEPEFLGYTAAAMKVRNDGTVIWYTKFTGT